VSTDHNIVKIPKPKNKIEDMLYPYILDKMSAQLPIPIRIEIANSDEITRYCYVVYTDIDTVYINDNNEIYIDVYKGYSTISSDYDSSDDDSSDDDSSDDDSSDDDSSDDDSSK
jgi:hypothetical protein